MHKLVAIGELGHKDALEVTLDLRLFRGRDGLQVLQHTDKRYHTLRAEQRERLVAYLVNSIEVFPRIFLQLLGDRVLARHDDHYQVNDLSTIQYGVGIGPVHLNEDHSLLPGGQVGRTAWVRGHECPLLLVIAVNVLHHLFNIALCLFLGLLTLCVFETLFDQIKSQLVDVTGRSQAENSDDLRGNVVQVLLHCLNRILGDQFFMVLGDEVEPTPLHDHFFALGASFFHQNIVSCIFGL